MPPDSVEAYTGLTSRVLRVRAFLQDAVDFLATSFKSKSLRVVCSGLLTPKFT
jgi:hypothetical protein